MQEFWFCKACKSMNRADADRCYRCRAPKIQATMATARQRQPGVVLTPGLDEEHREVAWALMSGRKYISAWKLGYVAASLIPVAFALLAFSYVVPIAIILGNGLLDSDRLAAFKMDPSQALALTILVLVAAAVFVSMLVMHSIFLGLTSMNCPALGAGSPRFGPVRAGLWWVETLGWVWWGFLSLWVVPYVIARAFGLLCGPIEAIGKPRRLLQDLSERLGVPGSSDSRLVGHWSMAWGTARGIGYAIYLGPVLLAIAFLFLLLITSLLGLSLTPAPEGQVRLYSTLLVVFVLGIELTAESIALLLLAGITMELSRRQRVREEWVFSGLNSASARAAAQGPATAVLTSAAQGPGYAPQPQPQPQPSLVAQEPGPQSPPSVVTQPPDELPADSRTFERFVARPSFEPLPLEELPPAWSRAIQQVPPPAGPAAKETEPEDRPVIQPSPQAISRHRAPLEAVESDHPVDSPPDDFDMGGGI